jgi:hypothetical protein
MAAPGRSVIILFFNKAYIWQQCYQLTACLLKRIFNYLIASCCEQYYIFQVGGIGRNKRCDDLIVSLFRYAFSKFD